MGKHNKGFAKYDKEDLTRIAGENPISSLYTKDRPYSYQKLGKNTNVACEGCGVLRTITLRKLRYTIKTFGHFYCFDCNEKRRAKKKADEITVKNALLATELRRIEIKKRQRKR